MPKPQAGFTFGRPASNVAASGEPGTLEATGFQFNEADTTTLTPASDFSFSQPPPIKCVLDNPDETSDVVLEVEGKQLHASRAVLAHYSPVFCKMFYSDFKEKSETKVPLPGKTHEEMALFFNVMYAQDTASSAVGKDEELVPLLTLADEYQVDQVKVKCQEYIGEQLAKFYQKSHAKFKRSQKAAQQNQTGGLFGQSQTFGQSQGPQGANIEWVNRLTLFLRVCDEHQLPRYRDDVMSLLVEQLQRLDDVAKAQYYDSLPLQSKVDLLERLCRKLDGSADNLQPSATAARR